MVGLRDRLYPSHRRAGGHDLGRGSEQVLRAHRIQTDRGHKVIDNGPYAIIRHPGYAFGYPRFLRILLALGSVWALIPAILLCPLLVLRTIWEDRTLREELTGYEEYSQRVRYRLIPGVW